MVALQGVGEDDDAWQIRVAGDEGCIGVVPFLGGGCVAVHFGRKLQMGDKIEAEGGEKRGERLRDGEGEKMR